MNRKLHNLKDEVKYNVIHGEEILMSKSDYNSKKNDEEKNDKNKEDNEDEDLDEDKDENIQETNNMDDNQKNENKKNDIKVEIVEIQNRESTLSSKKLTRKPQEPNYMEENTKNSNVTAKTYRRIEEYATIISAIQEEFPEIEQKIEHHKYKSK